MNFFKDIENITLGQLWREADNVQISKNTLKIHKQNENNKMVIEVKNYKTGSSVTQTVMNNSSKIDVKETVLQMLNEGNTQSQISDVLGISQAQVSRIKNNKVNYSNLKSNEIKSNEVNYLEEHGHQEDKEEDKPKKYITIFK